MAYNLDAFEVFVVSIPDVQRLLGWLAAVSLLGGLAGAMAAGQLWLGLPLAAGVFFTPGVVAGEAIHRLVPAYPRDWGLYLALISTALAAVLLPVVVGIMDVAAAWLPIGVAGLNTLEVLVVSTGLGQFHRLALAAAIQPATMAAGLAWLVPAFGHTRAFPGAVVVIAAAGLGLWIASAFVEWLVDANVTEVDGLEITANLVQRSPLELDLGSSAAPPIQSLDVETSEGAATLAAPWIHPGILEGIGGGRLTQETIGTLNEDGAGFFLHVPCSHRSNAAEPNVHERVLAGLASANHSGQASRLYSHRAESTTFHGRRYGDSRVVFVESDAYGDFEIGVFAPVVDPHQTLVVDRHVRADGHDRTFVTADSDIAERLRAALAEFLQELDDAPIHDYRAGYATDIDLDDRGVSLFALIEVVDGQRTLLLGGDQNEQPAALIEAGQAFNGEFDTVLPFTTDTHASVYAERFDPQPTPERVRRVIDAARDRIADAAAGLANGRTAETRLLGPDYDRLIHTLNVGARVYIVLLGTLYLVLLGGLLIVL